jgi:hypothetical protein
MESESRMETHRFSMTELCRQSGELLQHFHKSANPVERRMVEDLLVVVRIKRHPVFKYVCI